MIDEDEFAAYEEWKANKLAGLEDLSVAAFNREMEALALAWDAAIIEAVDPSDFQKINSLKARNPYRGSGMTGARPTRRVTS